MKARGVRIALAGALVATGCAVAAVQTPASGLIQITSKINTPTTGSRYWVTDATPSAPVQVKGTTNASAGTLLDVRCYTHRFNYWTVAENVVVAADKTFSTSVDTQEFYGWCRLRAVPDGMASTESLVPYTGPMVATQWNTRDKVSSGPNAGKVYDYYYAYQSSKAFNDYVSATRGGLWDSRLTYSDGSSSPYLWYGNGGLQGNENGVRAYVTVDGNNAFGPETASEINQQNAGFPALTVSITRNQKTGVVVIKELNPLVKCPNNTVPATSGTCASFSGTGVRLERTIVTSDAGRQTLITDVWRSTDGAAHVVSPHYQHSFDARRYTSGGDVDTPLGLRIPWISALFKTFTAGTRVGTGSTPATITVRNDNNAADGSSGSPVGTLTSDSPIAGVRWFEDTRFALNQAEFTVPAGGTYVTRQHFALGTKRSEVEAKAAAARVRLNPFRSDALVRKVGTKAYLGNGVYSASTAGQTLTTTSKRARTVTFLIAVQNDGTRASHYRVRGPGSRSGFGVKYLKGVSGNVGVTGAVTGTGFLVGRIEPGTQRYLRLVVTVKPGAKLGTLAAFLVRATSTRDAKSVDVVRPRIRVIR